ncbi:MAG: hypothetical protein Kow00127_23140 [Bacteroidales bacterium]
MKGDILILDDNHRNAAKEVLKIILCDIRNKPGRYVITVAGESGAGKSEVARAIADILEGLETKCFIFGQDDYFVYPPHTNSEKRKEDISWVGPQEVRLDLLDANIADALQGKNLVRKPLVDFDADEIGEEDADLAEVKVLIAEGTYTTLLKNADCRVFIDRNKMDTIESRQKRNREPQDEFLDRVLTIEHEIISKHKALADLVITRNWEVVPA